MDGMVAMLAGLGRQVVDFALPPRCPGCGVVVDADDRFCARCWSGLRFLADPLCARCGAPLAAAAPDCDECRERPPAFHAMRAAIAYGDTARRVALRLKYGRRPGVARIMATMMTRLLADVPADALLCAVPLHRRRLWMRGYNQALLIARALARRTGRGSVPDLLVRTLATPVLRDLDGAARARAVAGAFAVPAHRRALVRGRPVLLVDDVFTSGATASACAHALRDAGAARVTVLCWARVVPER